MVYKHFFGRTPEGQAITRFTLFNHNTMEVNLLNYGAAGIASVCRIKRAWWRISPWGVIPLQITLRPRTLAEQ